MKNLNKFHNYKLINKILFKIRIKYYNLYYKK